MADTTGLDPQALYALIDRFRQVGFTFKGAVDQMTVAGARYAGSWGNDEFGRNFAAGYVPNAEETFKNVHTFLENISLTADNFKQAVDYLVEVDQHNADNT